MKGTHQMMTCERRLPLAGSFNPEELQVDLFTLYQRMLAEAQPCVNTVFSALGVPDETIVADYALTDGFMADRLEARRKSAELDEIYRNVSPSWLRAEPATMAQTLALIQGQHGSIEAFLLASGVTQAHLQPVRGHLLE
jgi:hypothetical protein